MSGDERAPLIEEKKSQENQEKEKPNQRKIIFKVENYQSSTITPLENIYNNNNNDKNNANKDNNNKDDLPQSINEILLNDEEFASPVVKKKENKIISDYHYVTFQNDFGENTCFINVILHLLNNIPELDEYLISLYQIYAANKDIKYKKTNKDDKNLKNINKFLVLLGKILNQYETIISKENEENKLRSKSKNKNKKKQVTIIKTLYMRKILENISSNKFALNSIADPIELFTFILDILNEYLNGDLHKSFYLELIDEFYCQDKNNCQKVSNKYDKDNFIYHIYIDEILNFIEQSSLNIKDYKSQLFKYSYKLFLSENKKTCEKCRNLMTHELTCLNCPEFLLINCVWKESNPLVDDVIKFFLLLSLKDELNNLFICSKGSKKRNKKNQNQNQNYCLLGFILYSFTLSHYIICIYNREKKIFVLFDDEAAKEYNNLYDLIIDITVNALKVNGKAFFYPVMLIYKRGNLYDNKFIKFNTLNDDDYQKIIYKCNEAISEYELQNKISEEEKYNNYKEYIQMQMDIESSIKKEIKNKEKNHEDNNKEDNENDKEVNNNKNNEVINIENEKKENIIDIIEDEDKNANKNKNKNKMKDNKKGSKNKKKKWIDKFKNKKRKKQNKENEDLIEIDNDNYNDNKTTKSKRKNSKKKIEKEIILERPILKEKKINENKKKNKK